MIGVDDIPAAALAAPPLTTVASNITVTALDIVDAVLGKLERSFSGARSPTRRQPRRHAGVCLTWHSQPTLTPARRGRSRVTASTACDVAKG